MLFIISNYYYTRPPSVIDQVLVAVNVDLLAVAVELYFEVPLLNVTPVFVLTVAN
jgi:hypothetical protein